VKKIILSAVFYSSLMAGGAAALEFKNYGTVGMGGAGVAKPPLGAEGYWNPAALGLLEDKKAFHTSLLVSASSKGNLIDDLDRLNSGTDNRTQPGLPSGPSEAETLDWIDAGMADSIAIDVPFISMGKDPDNVIRAGGGLAIGQKVGRWGVGYYCSIMSKVHSDADLFNILPDEDEVNPMTLAGFNSIWAQRLRGPSNTFFTPAQASTLETSLVSLGMTPSAAFNIRNSMDFRFTVNNAVRMKPDEVADALIAMVRLSASGTGGLIAKNQTLIGTTALILNEVPISYGRQFDFGSYGKVAAGVTVKAMMARLYTSSFLAYLTDIETVYDRLADSYKDSINFGIDTGAIWTLDSVSLGVTAKNLNSPQFDRADGSKLTVRPSVRAGINYEPTSWLRAALDVDLTKSSELTPNQPLQILGGGVELKPYGRSLLRLGCYQNIASDDPAVLTAGVGYAGDTVTVNIDGAYGLGSENYRGGTYTNEAQLQLSIGVAF